MVRFNLLHPCFPIHSIAYIHEKKQLSIQGGQGGGRATQRRSDDEAEEGNMKTGVTSELLSNDYLIVMIESGVTMLIPPFPICMSNSNEVRV